MSQLETTCSPILRHPNRPVVVWAAGDLLFALNLELNKFECRALEAQVGAIHSIEFCNNDTSDTNETLHGNWLLSGTNKSIVILRDETFEIKERFLLRKKLTAAKVSYDGKSILYGDKFGELFQLTITDLRNLTQRTIQQAELHMSINKNDQHAKELNEAVIDKFHAFCTFFGDSDDKEDTTPFAGHLAAITAMEMTSDRKLLISADKDEKIRVCRVEDPHITTGYGLGHTEFIVALCSINASLIASASADRTIRLWDIGNSRNKNLPENVEGCIELSVVELKHMPASVKYSEGGCCLLVICEELAGAYKLPLEKNRDGANETYFLGEPSEITLPGIPVSIQPLTLYSKELSYLSFQNLQRASQEEFIHTLLWVNVDGRLELPQNVETGLPVYLSRKWLGLETGDAVVPSRLNYWKKIRLADAPSVEEIMARRKRNRKDDDQI